MLIFRYIDRAGRLCVGYSDTSNVGAVSTSYWIVPNLVNPYG